MQEVCECGDKCQQEEPFRETLKRVHDGAPAIARSVHIVPVGAARAKSSFTRAV